MWTVSIPSISGDSGCGLFRDDGMLASVVWGSDGSTSSATDVSHLITLCNQVCQPSGGRVLTTRPPTTPSRPIVQQPPPTQPKPIKGDKGEKGDPGDNGKDADNEAITKALLAVLRQELQKQEYRGQNGKDCDTDAVVAKLKADREFLLSVAALVNVPQPPTNPGSQHIVLVADRAASYWGRLADEVKRAQDVYRGIEVVAPPAGYTGPLPQIVQYENGVPRVLGTGQNQVSSVLSRIVRGDGI